MEPPTLIVQGDVRIVFYDKDNLRHDVSGGKKERERMFNLVKLLYVPPPQKKITYIVIWV